MFEEYKCIGILGGTFNPLHMGHIHMAEAVIRQYERIEKIIFFPNNYPRYKDGSQIAQAKHRLAMLRAGTENLSWAQVSDMEISRGGVTYTYDTLTEIAASNQKLHIYYIIGSDSLLSFDKWFRYKDILKLCTLVVGSRDGGDRDKLYHAGDVLTEECGYARIEYLDMKEFPVSSTEIRKSIASGNMPVDLLPSGVAKYIVDNKLYI